MRLTLLLVFLVNLSVMERCVAENAPPKVVAVPRAASAIAVDGKLDERAWRKAARIPSFEHYRKAAELRNQTEVLLLYDEQAFYVGCRCSEAEVTRIRAAVTQHDGSLWEDDCVEIFLDTKADRAGFLHFILNTIGTRYDALGEDPYGYNPTWEGKAKLGAGEWTAEIRIPFSELGAPTPEPGDHWLGNFCREQQPAGELSCWSATMGGFAAPGKFGEIIFGSLADRARADIHDIRAAMSDIEKAAQAVQVSSAGLLSEARSAVETAESMLGKGPSLSEAAYLEVQSLLRKSRSALAKLGDAVRRAEMGNPDYLVWETSPWKHFSPKEDYSAVSRDTESVGVLILVGQTESKALMVSNLTDETLSARLLLEGFDGLPEGAVEILIPTFVRCADGRAFPDALVPPDPIRQITIPPGETRQIWINIKGAKPGQFEGNLTISPLTASESDKQVRIAVEIVQPPKELPEPLAFTWDYLGDAERLGLENEYVQTMVDHGIRVFMISGLRYMPRPEANDEGEFLEPVDWSRFEREVQLKWKPGRKLYINLDVWEKSEERRIYNGRFDSPGWRIAFKKIISEMAGVLQRLGLSYDDYWVCPVDECIDDRYVAIARLVKEVDPGIRIVEDTIGESLEQVKEADKYTDWWTPHFKAYFAEGSRAQIEYLKSTGKPLGFYFYSEGANEKAQDSYGHYLCKFWYAYSQGLNGIFGYWTATQHYGDPWNRHQTTASYDPSLFYYGNGCVITGRRWEAWRRGIEDFALLRLCQTAGLDKAVLSQAVKSVLDAPNDPTAAERAREQLIRGLAGLTD